MIVINPIKNKLNKSCGNKMALFLHSGIAQGFETIIKSTKFVYKISEAASK